MGSVRGWGGWQWAIAALQVRSSSGSGWVAGLAWNDYERISDFLYLFSQTRKNRFEPGKIIKGVRKYEIFSRSRLGHLEQLHVDHLGWIATDFELRFKMVLDLNLIWIQWNLRSLIWFEGLLWQLVWKWCS
jgi:hypothetical protein